MNPIAAARAVVRGAQAAAQARDWPELAELLGEALSMLDEGLAASERGKAAAAKRWSKTDAKPDAPATVSHASLSLFGSSDQDQRESSQTSGGVDPGVAAHDASTSPVSGTGPGEAGAVCSSPMAMEASPDVAKGRSFERENGTAVTEAQQNIPSKEDCREGPERRGHYPKPQREYGASGDGRDRPAPSLPADCPEFLRAAADEVYRKRKVDGCSVDASWSAFVRDHPWLTLEQAVAPWRAWSYRERPQLSPPQSETRIRAAPVDWSAKERAEQARAAALRRGRASPDLARTSVATILAAFAPRAAQPKAQGE